jgi:hypothetical protein
LVLRECAIFVRLIPTLSIKVIISLLGHDTPNSTNLENLDTLKLSNMYILQGKLVVEAITFPEVDSSARNSL